MKFLIADDHRIVRFGIKVLLQSKFVNAEIEEASTSRMLLHKVNSNSYDLLILDVQMDETISIKFIKDMLSSRSTMQIVIFSYFPENTFALHYLRAGAKAYIEKKESHEILLEAISFALDNKIFVTDELNNRMRHIEFEQKAQIESLSEREVQVLQYLVQGYSLADMQKKLNLKITTISTYKKRIFEKLNTSNIVDIQELAKINNLI